jgi:hypothetical protein
MTAVINTEISSVAGSVLAGILPLPLTQPQLQGIVHFTFPDFRFHLTGPLLDFQSAVTEGSVKAKVALGKNVFAEIELKGYLEKDGTYFHTEEVFLQMRTTREIVQAEFVASTLIAMLGLADEVDLQIPDIKLNMKLSFEQSLLAISRKLQWRQLAYRLMVIEQAIGLEFNLPMHVSGNEMESIAFIYHAIVARSFDWPDETFGLRLPANQVGLDILSSLTQPISLTFFSPQPISKFLFGKEILLGQEQVTIQSRRIINLNEVSQELSSGDDHLVEVIMQPLDGQLHHELPDAPRLPAELWNANIQSLIDLESELDARLANGYHALAAATLEGLSEEEKAAVTARFNFEDEFVGNDAGEE